MGAAGIAAGALAYGWFAAARPARRPQTSGPEAPNLHGTEEQARGRAADTPVEIPPRGWKDIALRVYAEISNDRLLAVAAGVTFYALLAIFPALVALVSIYGLTSDLATLDGHLSAFSDVVPQAGLEIVREQVARIVTKSDGALGFAFVFGLGAALWSANAGVKALFDALNVVYEEREKRSFVGLNLRSLAFTLGAILFLLTAFNAVVVLPVALEFVGLGHSAELLLKLSRWPVLFGCLLLALTLLYRFGPSRRRPKWRWAMPGSLLAAVLWIGGSIAFSWYAENLATYNETYGSLGAAIGFMTWIWMSVIVVLLGGELNAELEHQTAIDTTTGAARPLGARGATMADEVAS
ncbi:YihY/virulence factor BrkB family protein [Methylopila musalis]|uniref:YihY/virulence factor BrkB family protein n=1 Tax=Methylopila musalis TaxID=1134781 RepID=A0ABW3Z565_9HYPH